MILHYNGSAWTQMTAPDNSGLLDVDAVSPTDAWAIAADGSVLNWNGSAWSVVTTLELSNDAAIAARRSGPGRNVWAPAIAHHDASDLR